MKYRFLNRRTGNAIDVPCRLEGPDWEEITEAKAMPDAAPAEARAGTAKAKAEPKRTQRRKADG